MPIVLQYNNDTTPHWQLIDLAFDHAHDTIYHPTLAVSLDTYMHITNGLYTFIVKISSKYCIAIIYVVDVRYDEIIPFDDVSGNKGWFDIALVLLFRSLRSTKIIHHPPAGCGRRYQYYAGNMDTGLFPLNIARVVFDDLPKLRNNIATECIVTRLSIEDRNSTDMCIAVIPYAGYDGGDLSSRMLKAGDHGRFTDTSSLFLYNTDHSYVSDRDWIYVWVEDHRGPYAVARGLMDDELQLPIIAQLLCPSLLIRDTRRRGSRA